MSYGNDKAGKALVLFPPCQMEEKTLVYPPLPLPRPRPDQPGRPVSSRTCTVLPLVKFCNCAAVK
jgi:hypothetical protein